MLVVVVKSFPIGQVWLDFTRKRSADIGVIWALRLMPSWKNQGIGTRLLTMAEDIFQQQGFAVAELSVSKPNTAAQRLYVRQGYRVIGEENDGWDYLDAVGQLIHVEDPCWILQKSLTHAPAG